PGAARVRMTVQADYALRPVWDVVGKLRGGIFPDEAIILGAHRDSWGPGATDNGSGSATLLEVARRFGELARAGSRPSRSLMFAFWDAEEFGIIGSTEWAEDHAQWLSLSAVAYLNVDVAATGARFNPSGTPSLWPVLLEAADGVPDPRSQRTVRDVWQSTGKNATVGVLGGGSDFVPFSHDLGVPSTSHSFSGDGGGAYHSRLDTWWFVSSFMDPGFSYHAAAGGIWALTALKLSETPVIPYDEEATGKEATAAADEIESRWKIHDPTSTPMPSLDPVRSAARRLTESAGRLATRRRGFGQQFDMQDTGGAVVSARLQRLTAANRELIATEREFIVKDSAAADQRARNLLLSPSATDGYGAQRLPGIAAAFLNHDPDSARREIDLLVGALDRAAGRLEAAARALKGR
ncbi:MAG TPA: M28 family peptidase, partial [Patescibacteria group bacterium]|nr:M28 family peptidase [Patescibacteria group bacterium]